MKKWKKYFVSFLSVALLFNLSFTTAFAADEYKEYTYTVKFYAGAQGEFSDTASVSVNSAEAYDITKSKECIEVSGLAYGDTVSFQPQTGNAVLLEEGSKYYIRGVRKSGRDNRTVNPSAFRVTEDRDYVVAYGVKGNLTNYVVNYHDQNGNEIAPSTTYYGNVGDKPVVAYLYIEGYVPQALGLTKTLSENEAENVFTFVYERVQSGETTTPGTTPEGGTTTPESGAGQEEQRVPDGEETMIPDEEVPLEDGDIVDLDEEEVPLADASNQNNDFTLYAGIAIGVGAIFALIVLIVIFRKRSV